MWNPNLYYVCVSIAFLEPEAYNVAYNVRALRLEGFFKNPFKKKTVAEKKVEDNKVQDNVEDNKVEAPGQKHGVRY
jgi:hypothetical protein